LLSRWSSGLVGSNPTPGAFGSTPCVETRHIQIQIEPTALSQIISFGLWMRKQGYRHSTIKYCIQALKSIARRANLLQPESTKAYLASAEMSESRKAKLTEDLARFYGYSHLAFDKPNYRRIERLPFVPLEVEVDQLISGVSRKIATFLQLIKETGARAGEAWNLRWIDLDPQQRTVNICPEKNSNPRQLTISIRLVGMLNALPKRYKLIFRNPDVDPLISMEVFRRLFGTRISEILRRVCLQGRQSG
jgi:integrase